MIDSMIDACADGPTVSFVLQYDMCCSEIPTLAISRAVFSILIKQIDWFRPGVHVSASHQCAYEAIYLRFDRLMPACHDISISQRVNTDVSITWTRFWLLILLKIRAMTSSGRSSKHSSRPPLAEVPVSGLLACSLVFAALSALRSRRRVCISPDSRLPAFCLLLTCRQRTCLAISKMMHVVHAVTTSTSDI